MTDRNIERAIDTMRAVRNKMIASVRTGDPGLKLDLIWGAIGNIEKYLTSIGETVHDPKKIEIRQERP